MIREFLLRKVKSLSKPRRTSALISHHHKGETFWSSSSLSSCSVVQQWSEEDSGTFDSTIVGGEDHDLVVGYARRQEEHQQLLVKQMVKQKSPPSTDTSSTSAVLLKLTSKKRLSLRPRRSVRFARKVEYIDHDSNRGRHKDRWSDEGEEFSSTHSSASSASSSQSLDFSSSPSFSACHYSHDRWYTKQEMQQFRRDYQQATAGLESKTRRDYQQVTAGLESKTIQQHQLLWSFIQSTIRQCYDQAHNHDNNKYYAESKDSQGGFWALPRRSGKYCIPTNGDRGQTFTASMSRQEPSMEPPLPHEERVMDSHYSMDSKEGDDFDDKHEDDGDNGSSCMSNLMQSYQESSSVTNFALVGLEHMFVPTLEFDRDCRRFAILNAIQEIQQEHRDLQRQRQQHRQRPEQQQNRNNSHNYYGNNHTTTKDEIAKRIRAASQGISRPARIFATQLAVASSSTSTLEVKTALS
ncbi:hypothetical protein ACA910_006763 [Epithemia clementina (nom. ined.)]